ncbi:MAG: molybdopterin-binding protein, partial [bacterium]|nr:molybdopterin-binding protein [bacterium]
QLGENFFKKAVFIKRGEIILRKGTLIDERKIGIFPLLEKKKVKVYKKPKIGVVSIGKNIAERNDINWVILKSLIENNGGRVIWVKRVKSCDEFISIFRDEKNLDFIVSSGGVSKGREDFVFAAISKIGTPIFHGVKIKPGKPLCFGKINETPILSLSGNPTPCLITAYLFLVPSLRKMAHLPFETEVERLKAGASLNIKKIGKGGVKILPIKIKNGLVLFPNIPFCFSSIMGLKDTMGLAIIDEGVEEIRKGSNVKVFKFKKY